VENGLSVLVYAIYLLETGCSRRVRRKHQGFISAKVGVFERNGVEYFPENGGMFRKKAPFFLCATVCCVAEHIKLFAGTDGRAYLCSTLDT